MKKKLFLLVLLISVFLTSCSDEITTTIGSNDINEEEMQHLSYTTDFYNNFGERFLSVEGKSFSISPNKIKTYSWDSDGSWISSWEMSSIMTIKIDGKEIETCGSTVIFSDTRLIPCDIDFSNEISTIESITDDSVLTTPSDLRFDDYWKIKWWFIDKNINNWNGGSRLVIIQSQLGNPICMYSGNDVTWDIPKNLPKTTEIIIDGKELYIHRANFSIIDLNLLIE